MKKQPRWHYIELDTGGTPDSGEHWDKTLEVEFNVELAELGVLLAKHAELARLFPEED